MTEKERKVHDLDELFGQAQPIVVKWEGKEYQLRRPDSFGPKELNQFQHLQEKSAELQSAKEGGMSDEQADQLEELTHQSIEMLNEKLVEKLSFIQKVNVLAFYAEQVREELPEGEKKRLEESLIGERSTPN